jgi:UTP:GlnB (protein PII) uridylyltransferase
MSRARGAVSIPRTVEETLDAFVAGVRARFGVRVAGIRLFGSYARGEAHEESDVDCLVLLDHVERDDDRAITDLSADPIWQMAGVVISPVVMSIASRSTASRPTTAAISSSRATR